LGATVVTILLVSALLPDTLSADRHLRVLMASPIGLIVGAIVGRLTLAVYVPENDTSKSEFDDLSRRL
jgi:hypothetical protein